MSRGKSLTRQQQKQAAVSKKGLKDFTAEDPIAKKISRPWIIDQYRKLYNEVCPNCRALIERTGGQAPYTDYCEACQIKAKEITGSVPAMLGKNKK